MKPDLSIVIFTRDDAVYLRRCLDCLQGRPSAARIEVFVVDNASSDGTVDLIQGMGGKLAVSLLALKTEHSFSRGNNLGLERARGAFVLFLNPDTEPDGAVIDRLMARLQSDPGIGLISPRLSYPDGTAQPTGWFLPGPWQLLREHLLGTEREVPSVSSGITDVGWLMGCFLLCPTEVLRELGGFDEAFWFSGTDLELCSRVKAAGFRVVRVEDECMVHVGHRRWDGTRRGASRDALVRYLAREHGRVVAGMLAGARSLEEAWAR